MDFFAKFWTTNWKRNCWKGKWGNLSKVL